jgi:trk system potassium uptake protein TrkH
MFRRENPLRAGGALQLNHPARTLALLFLGLIFGGGLLLKMPICARNEPLDWSTAYFTATSAVSLTGLAVVDTASTFTFFGQCVLLLLVQLGGLGYMLAATLLFILFRRTPAFHDKLLLRDSLGPVTIRDAVKIVIRAVLFTFIVEGIGALILAIRLSVMLALICLVTMGTGWRA